MNIEKEVHNILETKFLSNENSPLKMFYTKGNCKLIILTGDNASGKSFIARLFSIHAKKYLDLETIRVGMEIRTTTGFQSKLVFGDECFESTGVISLQSVIGGINTCNKINKKHVIIFDEPDIGLSEGYQIGMGKLFKRFIENIPEHTEYCMIITHSKKIVNELKKTKPHFISIGENKDLNAFLKRGKGKRIEDILDLRDKSLEMFKNLTKIME